MRRPLPPPEPSHLKLAEGPAADLSSRGARFLGPAPEGAQAQPVTVAEAEERSKDAESGRRLSKATLAKYRLMFRHLAEFAAKNGFLFLKQLDLNALRDFRDSWELAPRTALRKLDRARAFFRFASENEWISTNPARLIRGPANIRDTQKLPFEPAEMERILQACRQVRIQGCSNDRLLPFVLVLRYSALRIGDASMLAIDRFEDERSVSLHAKERHPRLRTASARSHEPRSRHRTAARRVSVHGPESLWMEAASVLWRRKLAVVFAAAKVQGGHPHRFRHTLAVELLKKGVPMEEVSILLGHSSIRITEKHYASWVQARQVILKAHVAKTWETFGVIEGGKAKVK